MKKGYIIIIISLLVVALLLMSWFWKGTVPSQLGYQQYLVWCQTAENGLKQSKEMGNLRFIAQYKPSDFISAQKYKVEQQQIKKQETESYLYFNFRIEDKDKQQTPLKHQNPTQDQYYQRLNYLSFDMEKDFYVLEGSDTLSIAKFQFVQKYSLAPYIDYVLGFKRKDKTSAIKGPIRLIYQDRAFGNGKIQLLFEKEQLERIPALTI